MKKLSRSEQILQLLEQKGELQVSELATLFDVTPITIRRDLDALESEGKLIRVHGKARLNTTDIMHEKPLELRLESNVSHKLKIARLASSFIRQGERIFIGSGSTLYYLAKSIDNSKRLWVITDALNSAVELSGKNNLSIFVIGGELTSSTLTTSGSYAETVIQDLHFDTAYISSTCVGTDGSIYHRSFSEHGIYKHLPECAEHLTLLVDSSKLGKTNFVKVGKLRKGDTLITDGEADPALIREYEKLGIIVKIAD